MLTFDNMKRTTGRVDVRSWTDVGTTRGRVRCSGAIVKQLTDAKLVTRLNGALFPKSGMRAEVEAILQRGVLSVTRKTSAIRIVDLTEVLTTTVMSMPAGESVLQAA